MNLGIDIGSRCAKFALTTGTNIKLKQIPTPELYHQFMLPQPDGLLQLDLEKLGLAGVDRIAATGYGRNNVRIQDAMIVSEILAHAQGAMRCCPELKEFCVLDLGGQDTKVIYIRQGLVEDFNVNDKCAAGSGRYLENMARILGVDLTTLFQYHQSPADLSTTCAVYAESELIGKMAEGVPLARLCAGVNHSTFLRLLPMLERAPVQQLVFVGGGAQNHALVHYLQDAGYQVITPQAPVYNGAVGCLEMLRQERQEKYEVSKSG